METLGNKKRGPNLYKKAGFFMRHSHWYLFPLLWKGYRKPLEQEDMFEGCSEEDADVLCSQLENYWEKELERKRHAKKPRLYVALSKLLLPYVIYFGFFIFVEEASGILQTVLLGWILDYFSSGSSITEAYGYALGIGLCALLFVVIHNPYFFLNMRLGLRLRVAATALIYKKITRISCATFHNMSTGKIVNLASTDVQRLEFVAFFLHYTWIGPLEVIAVGVVLWFRLGPACLAGLGFMMLFIPINVFLGRLFAKLRQKIVALTDERVKVMNEVISGMRVIKMYAWENSFAKLVSGIRKSETKKLEKVNDLRAFYNSLYNLVPYIVSLLIFSTYVALGNELTVSKVFSTLALLHKIRVPVMIFFPMAIQQLAEGYVSCKRVQEFLEMEEQQYSLESARHDVKQTCENAFVKLKNVSADWGQATGKTLKDINLDVNQSNSLVMIIGAVGSGKSSLLMTILGELKASDGKVSLTGKIGYVSQEPWVFSGTVRQNILFGEDLDISRYNAVVKACSLEQDLAKFQDGDATLVGERGVSLSGGQKARINLARAVYADADVYLLDDPLSAVDAQVGKELLKNCICGILKGKRKILVTHQLQYLHAASEIICLKEGSVFMRGTYAELMQHETDLVSLISEEFTLPYPEPVPLERHRPRREISRAMSNSSCQSDGLPTYELEDNIVLNDIVEHEKKEKEGLLANHSEKIAVAEEGRAVGSVKVSLYLEFFKAGGGVLGTIFVFLLCAVGQVSLFIVDWWLGVWAKGHDLPAAARPGNTTTNTADQEITKRTTNFYIFIGMSLGALLLNAARAVAFYELIIRASKNLHNLMFKAILKVPIYFFDTNPVGRILNRFSKDIYYMDDLMGSAFFDFVQYSLYGFGVIIINIIVTPIAIAVVIPLTAIFLFLRVYFLKSAREIRRLESVARSPMFSHLSATLQGLTTIRAYGKEEASIKEFFRCQNYQTQGYFMFVLLTRWFAIHGDLTCAFFVTIVSLLLVVASQFTGIDSAIAGLALTYATGLTGTLQWCIRQSGEVENMMTSVERVVEYTTLSPEEECPNPIKPPEEWPSQGVIEAKEVCFTYHKDLAPVLMDINFCINSGEKVGIVGRTGAGKSSLMAMLFRMADYQGTITIDGISVKDLRLSDLRTNISVIPQDPVLFSGSLRKNLDPFNEYSDCDIWNSLEEVQLIDAVSQLPRKLTTELAEAGANFSVGQRQLICLARAILWKNRILFVDEATANVDSDTDQLIQETIREKFKECTVLTIAHRLNTIMDSDRVMVLDKGRLVEFDEPHMLLQKEDGLFNNLVHQTGTQTSEKLSRLAKEAYDLRHNAVTAQLKNKSVSESKDLDQYNEIEFEPRDSETVIADEIA